VKRIVTLAFAALLALCLAAVATADDCGGTPCSADPPTTPAPTVVPVPWAPVSPLVLLPLVSK
jgi:hypothetical protein